MATRFPLAVLAAFSALAAIAADTKPAKAPQPRKAGAKQSAAAQPNRPAPGAEAEPPGPPRGRRVQDAPKTGPAVPPQAQVGWALADAATGAELEAQFPTRNAIPGSTQKLFTSWLALETFGPERTFATELRMTGALKDGVLKGNLILRGGGDPGFADAGMGPRNSAESVFRDFAQAVEKAGIRRVEGCVIGDGSYLEEEGPHPASLWEDAGNYYAGNVSGLSFNNNLYTLGFDGAASAGKLVNLQAVKPRHAGIHTFDNRLSTSARGERDSAYILGGFPSSVRLLRGTYPAGRMPFTIKGSLPNPAWTAAREFQDYLAGRGVTIAPPDGGAKPAACGDSLSLPNHPAPDYDGSRLLASHASAPLKYLVAQVNQKSDNNYAAQLLALAGKEAGRGGSWRGGLQAMTAFLDGKGFDRDQYHFRDGNGLSRYNWVSPAQLVKLLCQARQGPRGAVFQATLVGAPGTEAKLERYGPGWYGRLFVKTGTLEGVAALAGYLRADSGKWLAFAVIANNYDSRAAPDPSMRADPQAAFIPLLKRWAGEF